MAYQIKVLDSTNLPTIICHLTTKLIDDGRFKVEMMPIDGNIVLKKVRLTKAKEYCGQHPGPCQVRAFPEKKRKTTFLEWDDWVDFHGLVNDVLDELECSANVTSKPMETNKIMWMRKGRRRRIKYDWEQMPSRRFADVEERRWNHGTDDQFAPDPRQMELPLEKSA